MLCEDSFSLGGEHTDVPAQPQPNVNQAQSGCSTFPCAMTPWAAEAAPLMLLA